MSILDPSATTVGDLCTSALQECGRLGVGQTPLAEDVNKAWQRLQWVLQQWSRKRWLVYGLDQVTANCRGQDVYTVGPGGDFEVESDFNEDFAPDLAGPGGLQPAAPGGPRGVSQRPARIEAAFFTMGAGLAAPQQQQTIQNTQEFEGGQFGPQFNVGPTALQGLVVPTNPNAQSGPIDYPLRVMQSREDFSRIRLKTLSTLPQVVCYDPAWPTGRLSVWPVPQAISGYQITLLVRKVLPNGFTGLNQTLSLPPEYLSALNYSLAMALRSVYQIPTWPGDMLPDLEAEALRTLRGSNTAIAELRSPGWTGAGRYNIFSDQGG